MQTEKRKRRRDQRSAEERKSDWWMIMRDRWDKETIPGKLTHKQKKIRHWDGMEWKTRHWDGVKQSIEIICIGETQAWVQDYEKNLREKGFVSKRKGMSESQPNNTLSSLSFSMLDFIGNSSTSFIRKDIGIWLPIKNRSLKIGWLWFNCCRMCRFSSHIPSVGIWILKFWIDIQSIDIATIHKWKWYQ